MLRPVGSAAALPDLDGVMTHLRVNRKTRMCQIHDDEIKYT